MDERVMRSQKTEKERRPLQLIIPSPPETITYANHQITTHPPIVDGNPSFLLCKPLCLRGFEVVRDTGFEPVTPTVSR